MSQIILPISVLLTVFLGFVWAHDSSTLTEVEGTYEPDRYPANYTTTSNPAASLVAACTVYPSPSEKPSFVAMPLFRSGFDMDWRMGPDDESLEGVNEGL